MTDRLPEPSTAMLYIGTLEMKRGGTPDEIARRVWLMMTSTHVRESGKPLADEPAWRRTCEIQPDGGLRYEPAVFVNGSIAAAGA